MQTNAIAKTLSGIYRLLAIAFVLFILYFAQTLVIPLTVAALLTFLLAPLSTFIEKWVGRVPAALITVLTAFTVLGVLGYMFAKQLIEFGAELHNYTQLIQTKAQSLRFTGESFFNKITQMIENVRSEFFGPVNAPISGTEGRQQEVKLIDLSPHLSGFIESIVGSLFSILSMAGIVLLLVIFMLLDRDDIRSRIIKLMGQSRISSTTSAMKDASERVTTYLFRLLVVNVGFGLAVFLGLNAIGIPNPILWGCLAAILRFIPYIGSWIAALIPIILAFVISDSWMTPLLTITFFIVLELITAYGVEPFYYAGGTGVSSFALILAAIFWTWLWGPIGLLLSTPLTVCLVVLGQNVTNMNFLRVLLSQEQPLTPAEECYHRLLLNDTTAPMETIETYLQKNSLISLDQDILLPIIYQLEKDFRLDLIDAEKKGEVYQSLGELIEFLEINEPKEKTALEGKALCIPTRTQRDEFGSTLLAQALISEGLGAEHTKKHAMGEINALIAQEKPSTLVVVATAPLVLSQTRFLTAKIAQQNPDYPLVVCLLGISELDPDALEKLTAAGAQKVVYTISQAIKAIRELSPQLSH